ncbi:MAG: BolA family protein [Pseudomonadota bacterium]|jgi:BolA protein|nr:MAG: BolA family transcriptional regulator [Pseudomonadota bacterium]
MNPENKDTALGPGSSPPAAAPSSRESLARDLEARLRAALDPVVALALRDDSHLHAGHAGAREGAHFAVRIVSPRFAGLRLLQRHRLVYDAAAPLMAGRIHALQIDALTPEEHPNDTTGESR